MPDGTRSRYEHETARCTDTARPRGPGARALLVPTFGSLLVAIACAHDVAPLEPASAIPALPVSPEPFHPDGSG